MSKMRRDQLIAEVAESIMEETGAPLPTKFVYSSGEQLPYTDEWCHFAYCYDSAFEELWDKCYEETRLYRKSNLLYPLLFIFRQSIELWLKAAFSACEEAAPPATHNLRHLWHALVKQLEEEGLPTNDPFTVSVGALLDTLDVYDDRGDRFRYPTSRDANFYPSSSVDLDALFQAHYTMTTYCEAVCSMAQDRKSYLLDVV